MASVVAVLILLYAIDIEAALYKEIPDNSENSVPEAISIAILRHNTATKGKKPKYRNTKLNQLYTTIVRQGPSLDKYLNTNPLKCNFKLMSENPRTTKLRNAWDDEVMTCEKNCTNFIARQCNECIEETIDALAFSCKRTCMLHSGENEFLHEFNFETEENRCRKITSRCCTHNCLRQLGKACYSKKQLCTRETMAILKESCSTRCRTSSANPYLNTFCSFVHVPFKTQPKRAPFPFLFK